MSSRIETFFDTETSTASHLLLDESSKQVAIVDPVMGFDQKSGRTDFTMITAMLERVKELGGEVKYVLETHAHADHLTSADHIRDLTSARIVIGESIVQVQHTFADIFNEAESFRRDGSQFDVLVGEGDELMLGDTRITIMATPGHTPACVSYRVGDYAVFVGDTIFMPDVGSARCDFPGGDARMLYRSVQRLLSLDDEVRLYLCHDYPPSEREVQTCVTVKEQRTANIHMKLGISEDDFVHMRSNRDAQLDVPRLILPSLQVNIRAGALPQAEDNGTHYLKLPLNAV